MPTASIVRYLIVALIAKLGVPNIADHNIDAIATGLVTLGAIIWSWVEKRGKTPHGPSVGVTLKVLALSLIPFISGCKTGEPMTESDKLARAGAIAKSAAFVAASLTVQEHPEYRQAFIDAANEIEVTFSDGSIDAVDLISAINKLPVKELKSNEGRIAITAGLLLLEDFGTAAGGKPIEIRNQYVTAVSIGVRDGFRRAVVIPTNRTH